MAEKTVTFTGPQAILIIIALVAVMVFRFATLSDQRGNDDLVEKVSSELNSVFYPEAVESVKQAMKSGNSEVINKISNTVLNGRLVINELSVSAPLFNFNPSQRVVVKTTFTVPGTEGEALTRTRYYYYQHNSLTNHWSYQQETSVVAYYLNFI